MRAWLMRDHVWDKNKITAPMQLGRLQLLACCLGDSCTSPKPRLGLGVLNSMLGLTFPLDGPLSHFIVPSRAIRWGDLYQSCLA